MQQKMMHMASERADRARDLALGEIKNLSRDLKALEKALTAKKAESEVALLDIVQSALEIHRSAGRFFDGQALQQDIETMAEDAKDLEYLEGKNARQLREPEGWHWISPKGVMHFLAPSGREKEAAVALKKILSRKTGKKQKSVAKARQ
jgi:hypothetical protein